MTTKASYSPLQALAAKWRAIALVIVAFARLMRRYEDGCAAGAGPQAAQLQTIVRAAQVMLLKEMSEVLEAGPPETDADDAALAFLRMIAVCLLAITCLLQNMMARGLVGAMAWQLAAQRSGSEPAIMRSGPICGYTILDPG